MNTEETLTQLAINLAPDEVAEFSCNTLAEAKAFIAANSGRSFDETVVQACLQVLDEQPDILAAR